MQYWYLNLYGKLLCNSNLYSFLLCLYENCKCRICRMRRILYADPPNSLRIARGVCGESKYLPYTLCGPCNFFAFCARVVRALQAWGHCELWTGWSLMFQGLTNKHNVVCATECNTYTCKYAVTHSHTHTYAKSSIQTLTRCTHTHTHTQTPTHTLYSAPPTQNICAFKA